MRSRQEIEEQLVPLMRNAPVSNVPAGFAPVILEALLDIRELLALNLSACEAKNGVTVRHDDKENEMPRRIRWAELGRQEKKW